MSFRIGIKKGKPPVVGHSGIPFDDGGDRREPFANLIEALGGPEEASREREYPWTSLSNSQTVDEHGYPVPEPVLHDPIYHGEEVFDPFTQEGRGFEGRVTPAMLPTDVLSAIVDAYRNRGALGDERNRHLDMTNFMAEMTGMKPLQVDAFDAGEGLPSMSDEHGSQEYRDITDELGLRRDEIDEVRRNVPGIYPPLNPGDIQELSKPPEGRITTPDDITIDDWLLPEEQELLLSEPMDIAYQLLKERVSPAAIRHKLEYDTNYESNPKRVKYREQLNQERRRRGIYGSGNQMDISHTQGNKLSLEGQHANRARHFKNRGTLRRVRVR